uniref:Uncharacterized protein n=1 Tax=Noccaea caerulescens TaxID=107243 RepID=A0A1J3FLI9_NOCCA
MANLGGNHLPEIHSIYVETNLDTRLVVPVNREESVSDFRDKVCYEHNKSFPEMEEINITAFKIKSRGNLFCLSNHMNVSQAFDETRGNWNLYADAVKVEKEALLAIVATDQKCSNPELAEGNKETGIDKALVDVHNKDPNVEEGLTETQVSEKTTGKRKGEMSDGEKNGKKRSIDFNQSADAHDDSKEVEAVVAAPESESCEVLPRKEVDDVLAGDVGKENEKSVEDLGKVSTETDSHPSNHLETNIYQSTTTSREVVNRVPEHTDRVTSESSLISRRGNLDNPFVERGQKENEKREKSVLGSDKLANHLEKKRKSSKESTQKKKSKKSKSVRKEDRLVASGAENLEPVQVVDGEGDDNVIRAVQDSLQEKKSKKIGNLDKIEKKSKKIVESIDEVKNDVHEEALPLNTAKDTDALLTPAKVTPAKNNAKARAQPAASMSSSSDEDNSSDSAEVNYLSRKQGTNLAGLGTRMSLQDILRNSKTYKAAKLSVEKEQAENKLKYGDDESPALDK